MKIEEIYNDNEDTLQQANFEDENCHDHVQDEQPIFDTTDMFKTNIIFDSPNAAVDWCVYMGLANRVFVVRLTTHVLDKYKPNRHIIVACECSGKSRMNFKTLETKNNKIRATTTKITNCPFRLRISEVVDNTWKLQVVKGIHNHSPTLDASGHSLACKLSQKYVDTTKRLTKAGAKPRKIIAAIKYEDPSNFSKKQTIYNIRHQLKHEMMEDRSVLQ
ncbi:hypothetical protein LIER_25316 [Lithospermum erythrorhizon]|uniref:Protein FAR1-RELATED SEQUENCE n=1 Tax=Lithospermum erythrorhizon TaxID=34254 RepID=A0AAV3R479_LITER